MGQGAKEYFFNALGNLEGRSSTTFLLNLIMRLSYDLLDYFLLSQL